MAGMYVEAELTIEQEKKRTKKLANQKNAVHAFQKATTVNYEVDVDNPSDEQTAAARLIQRKFRQDQQKEVVTMSWHYSLLQFHKAYPTIPLAELWLARADIVENAMMSENYGLVNGYGDTLIQYSYVMLYSCVFPMAAFLACLVNVIYIRFSVDVNLRVVQRAKPQAAKNIGSWGSIVSFLTYAAIVSNIGILHYTFGGTFSEFISSNSTLTNMTAATDGDLGETNMAEWFDVTFDTAESSLWALIVLEHISIMAKILLELVIPDEPRWVGIADRNRRKLAKLLVIKEQRVIDALCESNGDTIGKTSARVKAMKRFTKAIRRTLKKKSRNAESREML